MGTSRWARWCEQRRWRERGAAALVLAVVTAGVIVPLGAFAVDIGMQRVARRDAQAVADTSALDAGRALAGCTRAGGTPTQAQVDACVLSTASASAALERGDVGTGKSVSARAGYIAPGTAWTSNLGLGCGSATSNGYFTYPVPSGKTANAVLVVVRNSVSFGLARAMGADKGGVCRSSISTMAPDNTCYKVGSFALGLDTGNSILGPLLGVNNVSAQVLSSAGVAAAQVSLLGLATQLGASTTDKLLTIPGLTIGQFLLASIEVLNKTGDTAHAALLQTLYADLGAVVSKPMNLAGLLDLGQGDASALDANVRVADLLTGALLVANGTNAVSVPGLNLAVPGVGTLTAKATIVQPPVIGCNGGVAKAAQVTIDLTGGTGSLVNLVASVSNLSLRITLANAWAQTDPTVTCTSGSMALKVSNQTLANIRLTANVTALLGLIPVATLDTGAPPTKPSGTFTLTVPGAYTTPVVTNSGSLGLDLTNVSATVLGIISLDPLIALLAPLLNAVTGLVTGTILPVLGISVAGANLWAVPPTPTCGGPKLVG